MHHNAKTWCAKWKNVIHITKKYWKLSTFVKWLIAWWFRTTTSSMHYRLHGYTAMLKLLKNCSQAYSYIAAVPQNEGTDVSHFSQLRALFNMTTQTLPWSSLTHLGQRLFFFWFMLFANSNLLATFSQAYLLRHKKLTAMSFPKCHPCCVAHRAYDCLVLLKCTLFISSHWGLSSSAGHAGIFWMDRIL